MAVGKDGAQLPLTLQSPARVDRQHNLNRPAHWSSAKQAHINDATTLVIQGAYRWKIEVTHFYNPVTRLNVIRDKACNFVSGWRLDDKQTVEIREKGDVW